MSRKKRVRVMHVLPTNRLSGAENVACEIINMFQNEKGYDMVYCCPEGPIRDVLKGRGIPFLPMDGFSPGHIKGAIWSYHPNIIHAHDMRASVVSSVICGAVPIVSHIHNNAYDARKKSMKSISFRLAARRIKHVIWVSEGAKDGYYYKKCVSDRSTVLRNIIDCKTIWKKSQYDSRESGYDVIFLGRLTPPKNPERLINVMGMIHEKCPDASFALVGSGELDDAVRDRIRKKGYESVIAMTGMVDNPYPILRKAKVMLMTSRWEGMPLSVLEALSLGVPVVSTPVEGVTEILDDGMGYISDQDAELSDAVVRILEDSALHDRLSQKSIRWSEDYNDIDCYRERLKKIYESV